MQQVVTMLDSVVQLEILRFFGQNAGSAVNVDMLAIFTGHVISDVEAAVSGLLSREVLMEESGRALALLSVTARWETKVTTLAEQMANYAVYREAVMRIEQLARNSLQEGE